MPTDQGTSLDSAAPPDGSNCSPTHNCANVSPGRVFAYVICIDKYKSSQIKDLNCCKADGQKFADFLTRRYRDAQIQTISDEHATCENIRAAFEAGPPQGSLQKDGLLIFFYAGHGSRIKAPPDWITEDGSVEVLCPHDAENGQNVVHDFIINHLLQKLAREYPNIVSILLAQLAHGETLIFLPQVLIIDSCHAAGNARDLQESVSRYTHFDQVLPCNVPDEYHQIMTAKRRRPFTEAGRSDSLLPFVLLAGCGQYESAYEARLENTISPGGHFTTALIKLLSEMPPGSLSYGTLIKSLPVLPHQTPECVGMTDRLLFTLERAADEGIYFDIKPETPDSPVYVVQEAGCMLGIMVGVEFKVRMRDSIENLGSLTVTDVGVRSCTASVTVTSSGGGFPPAAKAYLHSWSYNEGALKVAVGDGVIFPLGPEDKYAALVESIEQADLVLLEEGTHWSVERCDSFIAARTQAPRVTLPVADGETLTRILRAITHFHYHLLRPGGPVPFEHRITVHLYRVIRSTSETSGWVSRGFELMKTDQSQVSLVHSKDTWYGIELVNNSPLDLYPSLFYFDPADYSISVRLNAFSLLL